MDDSRSIMRTLPRGPLRSARSLFIAALLIFPTFAWAFDGRLLLPDGSAAAGFEVSVVGLPLTASTDAAGRFVINPDPSVPFQLVATGPAGEVSPVLEIASLPASGGVLDVALPATFRDSVTVTSGVAPGIEAPPAAATARISQQDLEQRRPQRLAEVLEGIPGASSSGEGPTGVPSVRGLSRGRTLILLDGARVTSERRAGPSAGFLDPFTLASVEIARGPGSVAYGSDAFGGVINARSRFPEPGSGKSLRFALDQGFGGTDERTAGLEAAGNLGGGAWLGQLHLRRADDGEAGGGDRILASAYRDQGGAFRYSVDIPAGRLRAAVTVNESRDTGNPAADSAVTRAVYPRESSRRFNLGLVTGRAAGWDSLEFDLFLGSYRLVLDRDRVATATVPRQIDRSDIDSRDGSLRALATRPALGGRLQLGAEVVSRFGLEAITDRNIFDLAGNLTQRQTTISIEEARRVDSALFLVWDRPVFSSALVSMGLRGDRVESRNKGGFFGDRSTSHDSLSGYAAITAGLTPRLTASLQASRGFRDPTLSDRYFRGPSGRGFVTGNPDLDPETSRQLDGSLRWAVGGGSVALFGYLYRIDDLIERFRPASDFLFRNRGEAEIRGVELEVLRPLGGGFQMELAATLTRGEVLDDDTPLADIPPVAALLTLRWAGERLFVYGRAGAIRRDGRPGAAELARPGHFTLDLGTGWHLTEALELRVVGKNLGDRRYRESADETAALAAGRAVTLGLVGRY